MGLTAGELIERIEAYFAAADRCDVAGTLKCLAADCVLEYVTEGERYEGRDTGVRRYFEGRAGKVRTSWHGNFTHTADAERGRVATRFAVRRTDQGVAERTGDNINLFEFEGPLIRRITVWRSPRLGAAATT
jgi:hypothetical protein